MTIIDLVCSAGHIYRDRLVVSLDPKVFPVCPWCDASTVRAWLTAPSINPRGMRSEHNTYQPTSPAKIDEKKIAADVMAEVVQKWQRYSDPVVAEQHVSREINEAAGIADAAGNEKPIPKPDPITFAKPTSAECAH